MPDSFTLSARSQSITFPRGRPLVMGIVNINDDSFSGDGTLDFRQALSQAEQQIVDGADVIDVGAESARTNREAISVSEEIQRLLPFIEAFPALASRAAAERQRLVPDDGGLPQPLLSINTWRSEVIEGVLPLGGDLINDISGLPDPRNAELCARHGAALLIMHTVGLPKVPHTETRWENVLESIDTFFEDRIERAIAAGLSRDHLVLDPGIDFAKQRDDNLAIFRHLERFHRFNRPVLLPVSRKTVIGDVLGIDSPADRDAGTLACSVRGHLAGAHLLRVHDVAGTCQSLRVLEAITASASSPA